MKALTTEETAQEAYDRAIATAQEAYLEYDRIRKTAQIGRAHV